MTTCSLTLKRWLGTYLNLISNNERIWLPVICIAVHRPSRTGETNGLIELFFKIHFWIDWRQYFIHFRYCPPFMYNETLYPDYTCGTAYVISGSLVPLLLKTAMTVPLFHLEDVYVTGILAKQLNVTPENHHLFSSNKYPIGNPCLYREIISSHGLSPLELRKVWKAINDPLLNCTNVSLPKFTRQDLKTCPN